MIDRQTTGWRDNVRLMFQEPRLLPWQRVVANVKPALPTKVIAATVANRPRMH